MKLLLIKIITAFLFVVDTSAAAATPQRPLKNEMTSIDFENSWLLTSDQSFPKEAFKAFPQYSEDEGVAKFVWFDLDRDGQRELIVAISGWWSGGKQYFVLKKSAKAWRLIAEFQGGFIFTLLDSPNTSFRITSYYRSGDTYQHTYDYIKGRYRRTAEVMIPRVISQSCWWDMFWPRLNGDRSSVKMMKSDNCEFSEKPVSAGGR